MCPQLNSTGSMSRMINLNGRLFNSPNAGQIFRRTLAVVVGAEHDEEVFNHRHLHDMLQNMATNTTENNQQGL